MAAWQFEGTVSYQSGKRVAYTAVSLGIADGQPVATAFRTDTDLAGRFQATLRDGPSGSAVFVAKAYDSWRGQNGADWVPVSRSGHTLSADLILPWDEPDICNLNGQWDKSTSHFVDSLLHLLDRPVPVQQALALRLLPVHEDGSIYESYPRDPAIERMFTQFIEEAAQARTSHAAMDMARRISDCLLRMGFAKRFDERIDVFRFALQGLHSRPKEDRKTHIRNLLKTLSMSLKRPFVPGNGAVMELESSTATMAIVLFAGAYLSLGRTDLKLKKEQVNPSQLIFQISVPSPEGR